jgi:predicted PilT family ATPase
VEENTSRVKALTGIDWISLEKIEELEPAVGCRIKSSSTEKKKEAILGLLKLIAGENEKLTVRILVPESMCQGITIDMVSIVIGKGGLEIKQLQSKTHTNIYIESYKAKESIWSCAKITGEIKDIAEATKLLYETMESKSSHPSFNPKAKAAVTPLYNLEKTKNTTITY